ncbi:MAG: energy-coupled thiamine transporter ThiT [Clostridia bacterium]|nr:energy-coupled thiamine transporter ThiT [Clostridia bacterium]MBQ5809114.1 energy-coupled thiamine transporter ThiT [Clostridia bacterium]MBR0326668.1 energy-coupled thiamine transporter ThiT [Clostridia bacterium]
MKKTKVRNMAESSVMIALALVLDMVVLWQAPLGGKWTLCAMLPIMLISVKNGLKWGLGTAFAYSAIQLGMSIAKVLSWGLTPAVLIGCLLFDYVLPYTVLGFAGAFCARKRKISLALAGIGCAIALRFLCHFISGTVFFGVWEDGVWQVISYSLLYNGQYLAPELALTMVVSGVMLNVPVIRKMMKLEAK